MTISRDQAADALREIDAVAAHSQDLKNYAVGAPILIMWGVLCMIGYGAGAVSPSYAVIWMPISVIGTIASVVLSRRAKSAGRAVNRMRARIGWTWGALLIFYVAAFAVLRPHEFNQYCAFPALLVALSYALMGIWTSPRYIALGALIAVCTLVGYFAFASVLSLWMAIVMGGGLILGGLWLRNA